MTGGVVMAVAMRVMDRPFDWGGCDCCTAACDVFAALHGVDPMARHRGAYEGARGAAVLIRSGGGWLAFADGVARDAGLVRTDEQAPGHLGLTAKRAGHRSLAICVAPGWWAAKSKDGLALVTDVERVWRV